MIKKYSLKLIASFWRLSGLITAAAIIGLPIAVYAQPDVFTARFQTYKRVITYNDLYTTSNVDWENLPFAGPDGNAYAVIPPGANELIAVMFSSETSCSNFFSSLAEWCGVQILINGTVAEPSAPAATGEFAFDSTDSGTATSADYESHSMIRVLCVTNDTTQNLVVPIQVQVRVTDSAATGATLFWLDDWSLDISKHSSCTAS